MLSACVVVQYRLLVLNLKLASELPILAIYVRFLCCISWSRREEGMEGVWASFTVYFSLGLSITTDDHMHCCLVDNCKLRRLANQEAERYRRGE